MANVSSPNKLIVTVSIFNSYCYAMIISPQVFLTKESPNNSTGYRYLMTFEGSAIFLLGINAVSYMIENKRRNKRWGTNIKRTVAEMGEDKMDYEKRGFRYI